MLDARERLPQGQRKINDFLAGATQENLSTIIWLYRGHGRRAGLFESLVPQGCQQPIASASSRVESVTGQCARTPAWEMPYWTQNSATQAEVKVLIMDHSLRTSVTPRIGGTNEELDARVYEFVWQRSANCGRGLLSYVKSPP